MNILNLELMISSDMFLKHYPFLLSKRICQTKLFIVLFTDKLIIRKYNFSNLRRPQIGGYMKEDYNDDGDDDDDDDDVEYLGTVGCV